MRPLPLPGRRKIFGKSIDIFFVMWYINIVKREGHCASQFEERARTESQNFKKKFSKPLDKLPKV